MSAAMSMILIILSAVAISSSFGSPTPTTHPKDPNHQSAITPPFSDIERELLVFINDQKENAVEGSNSEAGFTETADYSHFYEEPQSSFSPSEAAYIGSTDSGMQKLADFTASTDFDSSSEQLLAELESAASHFSKEQQHSTESADVRESSPSWINVELEKELDDFMKNYRAIEEASNYQNSKSKRPSLLSPPSKSTQTNTEDDDISIEHTSKVWYTDPKTVLIIGGTAAGLTVVLLVVVLVYMWRRRSKSTKDDLHRWDPQLLRPTQKNIDAFIYGSPLPSVHEMIKYQETDY